MCTSGGSTPPAGMISSIAQSIASPGGGIASAPHGIARSMALAMLARQRGQTTGQLGAGTAPGSRTLGGG